MAEIITLLSFLTISMYTYLVVESLLPAILRYFRRPGRPSRNQNFIVLLASFAFAYSVQSFIQENLTNFISSLGLQPLLIYVILLGLGYVIAKNKGFI